MKKQEISQWAILRNDKWLLSSLTWIPILLAVSIWWIFSQGIAKDLPIGVVDLQHSSLSRKLIRNFDATSILKVERSYTDVLSAKKDFVSNHIYGYVVIPKDFDRGIYLGVPPQVTAFYNSQFILIGKLINSAILQAHGTFNVQVSSVKQLAKGNATIQSAVAKSLAIRSQITPLFNKNSNYAQFLVSAIIPALWQISIVVSTVLLLAANCRIYGFKEITRDKPVKHLISIGMVYLPFFVLQGLAFLFCFYTFFEWPMFGNYLTIIFIQFITIIVCMLMGYFFFFLSLDPARALSLAGAFTAPSFAFMGVTFPVSDMNVLARTWRSLLPISHYIEAQIAQVSYGLSGWETISKFIPVMSGYIIVFFLVVALIRKQLSKQVG